MMAAKPKTIVVHDVIVVSGFEHAQLTPADTSRTYIACTRLCGNFYNWPNKQKGNEHTQYQSRQVIVSLRGTAIKA